MQLRERIYSGEMGLTPGASALPTEISTGHLEAAPNAPSPATTGSVSSEKRKRGRPRRSRADEAGSSALPLLPSLTCASTVTGNDLDRETPGGQQNALAEELMVMAGNSGEIVPYSSGLDYLAHVIFVSSGEDISMKIISFCQQGPKTVFVIACNGLVSNATLRQPGSSNEVTTYEGLFEIIKLSGSFTATDCGGGQFSRAGGLTLQMANNSGGLVVGSLAGVLTAASPVQLILGSYCDDTDRDLKVKKRKHHTTNHCHTEDNQNSNTHGVNSSILC